MNSLFSISFGQKYNLFEKPSPGLLVWPPPVRYITVECRVPSAIQMHKVNETHQHSYNLLKQITVCERGVRMDAYVRSIKYWPNECLRWQPDGPSRITRLCRVAAIRLAALSHMKTQLWLINKQINLSQRALQMKPLKCQFILSVPIFSVIFHTINYIWLMQSPHPTPLIV